MAHIDPVSKLLQSMTATPSLDKLSAWAADWKAIEAAERAEEEVRLDRRRMDESDDIWAADLDDGEEVAA
jgi:hypothetical protein